MASFRTKAISNLKSHSYSWKILVFAKDFPCCMLTNRDNICREDRVKDETITLKMADQERSDCNVVFTMIFCGLNFCVWRVMRLIDLVLMSSCIATR